MDRLYTGKWNKITELAVFWCTANKEYNLYLSVHSKPVA